MSDDDKVTRLPVRFKDPGPADRTVVSPWEVHQGVGCVHSRLEGASYVVDQKLAEVECSKCAAKLDPIWVMVQLAAEDRRMAEARTRYREEMKRLDERRRTKCDHCGKLTRISHR